MSLVNFGIKINVESEQRAPLSPRVQPSDCDDLAAENKGQKSLAVKKHYDGW